MSRFLVDTGDDSWIDAEWIAQTLQAEQGKFWQKVTVTEVTDSGDAEPARS